MKCELCDRPEVNKDDTYHLPILFPGTGLIPLYFCNSCAMYIKSRIQEEQVVVIPGKDSAAIPLHHYQEIFQSFKVIPQYDPSAIPQSRVHRPQRVEKGMPGWHDTPKCEQCGRTFTMLPRPFPVYRYHCRVCTRCLCSNCVRTTDVGNYYACKPHCPPMDDGFDCQ